MRLRLRQGLATEGRAGLLEALLCLWFDIVAALSQRGHFDRVNTQSIEKLLT